MKHWLLSVSLFFTSFFGIGQDEPANFSKVKAEISPKAEKEGLLIGFYDGEQYTTQFFVIDERSDKYIYPEITAHFLASPQLDGFHYFQAQSSSHINYNDDLEEDYGNYSCYDVSETEIISAKSIKALYTKLFENKVQEYQNKLADLIKFEGPKKEQYIECSLYENGQEVIDWITPGFVQKSSHYDAYHGGAHGDYGANTSISPIGSHTSNILTDKLFDQKANDKNWQEIKRKAYIKALTLQLDENDYAVSPYEPGEQPEFDYILDSLEIDDIEPEYPIDDYEDIYYKFLHKNGQLRLGVVFSASAPYVISHTYELTGSVDAGTIQQKMIGYNGVNIDFGVDHIHQLSPKQNFIVICEELHGHNETRLSFFSTQTGEFIYSEEVPGHPVMIEWCSEKHISNWKAALQDNFSKIMD